MTARLVAAVGLQREAAILAGALPGAAIVVGGGQQARLAAELAAAVTASTPAVLSFGLCGALDPALKAGDLVFETADPGWAAALTAAGARPAVVLGQDTIAASAAGKAAL
ncbi:MAG TPA: hypothetical protein VG939_07545, partial [Caulobacteraceae bacterium]|nr:hypothetical protein [Caulobacteraceae bacterium]